ncbi:MAG TPA: PBP1A family penicillin-binding protein [Thermoanaerobaculia bacterium]|jgi:penicillin-binding protein 1B|nr:PBP1A family penicillin-binding protein [Thermoanaerobaculia bacterium]
MATFNARLPSRRTVFQVLSISTVVVLVAIAILTLYVYKQSVGKFEIRRLSLPTRIYTDYTPLRGGVILGPDDLVEKLSRLGYRQVTALSQSGDYVPGRGQFDIYTRSFTHPTGQYQAQPVRIAFRNGAIDSVVSLRQAAPVSNAALEPELLASILSDQLENRRPVTLDQVPKVLQDAVIATEDVHFWYHPGVDPIGMLRALFRDIRKRKAAEGGSTLTQQLVKNYYLTSERTFKRKATEAFMAVVLDAKYSKREILEAYLNDIYLGRNRSISILGVGEASRFYFGKPVSEITLPEAALLASMIASPNNFSPFAHPDLALRRRGTVLGLMLNQKKITRAEYDAAMATKLPSGPFRQRSGLTSIPYYVDRVLQEMGRDYGIKDVKGRGLQIYTAIDLSAQDTAARTMEAGLSALEKGSRRLRRPDNPLQGAIINVDVATGEIRALIGGRNYDVNQFNRALNAKRQIGSLVKPFVYATAFEPSLSNQNITPATLVSDTRFILKRHLSEDWSPRNYEDVYHQTVTVAEALEQSLNSASVRIGLACGLDPIVRTAHTLGVVSDIDNKNPSMLLGAIDLAPIEMADAYATIARVGSRVPLHAVKFVTDDRNRILSAGDEVKPVQVFPARDMYILLTLMKGVVDRGTGGAARSMGFHLIAAGKTGTTNDKRDAWFIGFTPRALTLTWLGFDDNAPTGLSGGTGAVPIWTRFMQAVTVGQPNADFALPEGITMAQIDETSGGQAVPTCPPPVVVTEAFKAGTQPTNPCPIHSPQPVTTPAVDQFGNPIALDTAGMPVTPEAVTGTQQLAPITPEPSATTLTGGVFKTGTSGPPPATTTTVPPTNTSTSPPPR